MNILGIETSCDETAAAVVKDGREVLSNVVATSLKEHQKYGGIIPEIASRRQLEYINHVIKQALEDAKLEFSNIHAIAVTQRPGLIGSLLVGISSARALSFALNKPLIEVDHIQAHLYANFLDSNKGAPPKLPAIGLVVSGGHTSLFYVPQWTKMKLLGQTIDDAAGEAFDKVSRILELGYPGGPAIDRISQKHPEPKLKFPRAALAESLNFSFSGVKTAVLYHHRNHHQQKTYNKAEVASAFQQSVVTALIEKAIKACLKKNVKTLLMGGGVAANTLLRNRLIEEGKRHRIRVYFPTLNLCLDNAAMIAGLGYHLLKAK